MAQNKSIFGSQRETKKKGRTSTALVKVSNAVRFVAAVSQDLVITFLRNLRIRFGRTKSGPRNLTIGFDGYPFLEPLTGVGYYAYNVLLGIANAKSVTVNLYTHTLISEDKSSHLVIPIEDFKNVKFRHHSIPTEILLGKKFWSYVGGALLTPLFIALDRNDVFFAPNFVAPPLFRVMGK